MSGDYAFLFNDIFILSRKSTERPPFSYTLCRIIDRRSIIVRENHAQAGRLLSQREGEEDESLMEGWTGE